MAVPDKPTTDVDSVLRATLAAVAPGTMLRDGLERVLRGRTGGLVVLGYDKNVEALCSGGFQVDVDFTATRLRELAKMDGAVIIDSEGTRIHRGRGAPDARPDDLVRRDGDPPPHRRASGQADRGTR